jgi:hydroxypyruvate isomerase
MRRRQFVGACAGALAASRFVSAAGDIPAPASENAPFPLSVMLWTIYRDLPFEARLEKVAAAGYHAVELVNEFKGWKQSDFANARRKKQELKIEFDATAGVWHTLADASDREAFLKSVRDFVPTLQELECSRLILQTGNVVPGLTADQMRANCTETLKRGGEVAAGNGIELLVENIDPEENPKYFLTSGAEGFEIMRAVDHPNVKFLYDFFHEQIAEGNLIEKLVKNIELVGLVHIADVPGRHEPGTGEINYENIFRKLGELNYSRFVAMEYKPTGDPVESLRTAREEALKFGAEGRTRTSAGLHLNSSPAWRARTDEASGQLYRDGSDL